MIFYKNIIIKVCLALSVCAMICSCVPQKELVYLQSTDAQDSASLYINESQEYRLQTNDILDVQIKSMNPDVNAIFMGADQMQARQAAQVGVQSGGDLYYMTGYSINDSGNIDLPIIGKVYVLNQTIEEAKNTIRKEVEKYFTKFYLTVKQGGIRYSALGEFVRPGKYVILQNQVTIFEAIANAGDLNIVANRDDVSLIRKYPEGTKVHKINLLDERIIGSPFYYIQSNDIIYVEPLKQKSYGIGVTGAQTITTVISVISTSLALILAIQGLNN